MRAKVPAGSPSNKPKRGRKPAPVAPSAPLPPTIPAPPIPPAPQVPILPPWAQPPPFVPIPPAPLPAPGQLAAELDPMDDPLLFESSKYRTAYAKIAEHLCGRLGATDFELAEFIGVAPRTILQWRVKYPEFKAACALGLIEANERVTRSLYARAVGYSHPEEKIFCSKNGKVTRVDTIKHYAPDVTAATFWLTNRERKLWAMQQPPEIDKPELVSVDDLMNKLFQGHPHV